MGTPVPVREIVEAKKSEVETKLLQLAAEYVVFNPEPVERIIKEIAKIRLSLYVAYTFADLEKEIDLDCSPGQVNVTEVVYVGPYFLISAATPSRKLFLYIRGYWDFEVPGEMEARLEAEKRNIRNVVEKMAAALIQKHQDIASSIDSIREAGKLAAELGADKIRIENKIEEIYEEIDKLYEEIDIAEQFLRERGLYEEFEDYYDEKRGEEDESDS